MSLILGPVQNQNLPSRGPKCAAHLAHSLSLALCKQKNTLEIALDILSSLVSHSKVREWVTQTLQVFQILRDPQKCVHQDFEIPSSLALTVWELWNFEDWEEKNHCNDKSVQCSAVQ